MAGHVKRQPCPQGNRGEAPSIGSGQAEAASHHNLIEIWQQTLPDLKRLVAALGHAPETAEDILQDVCVVALKRAPQFADGQELRRWLFRVTVNRCRLEARRRARHLRIFKKFARLVGTSRPQPDAAETIASEQRDQAVRMELEKLDEELKLPLILRYFHGMNSAEIGRILAVADSTVRSRLRQGRMKLAAALLKTGVNDE